MPHRDRRASAVCRKERDQASVVNRNVKLDNLRYDVVSPDDPQHPCWDQKGRGNDHNNKSNSKSDDEYQQHHQHVQDVAPSCGFAVRLLVIQNRERSKSVTGIPYQEGGNPTSHCALIEFWIFSAFLCCIFCTISKTFIYHMDTHSSWFRNLRASYKVTTVVLTRYQ